nr:MAG: hypothetical protein [Microviridae sp.]
MSYKTQKRIISSLNVNKSYEGESIEKKMQRVINNREPIKDGAPRIYTERKNGVLPEHDIRTDRWEVAVGGMDAVNRDKVTKRENKSKVVDMTPKIDEVGGAENVQGTT